MADRYLSAMPMRIWCSATQCDALPYQEIQIRNKEKDINAPASKGFHTLHRMLNAHSAINHCKRLSSMCKMSS